MLCAAYMFRSFILTVIRAYIAMLRVSHRSAVSLTSPRYATDLDNVILLAF